MVETLDLTDMTQWPRYMFHPDKDPERVETPEEEGELVDLDLDWRRTPYSDLEKLEFRQEQMKFRGAVLRQEVTEPIETPPRQSAAERKREKDRLRQQRIAREKRQARGKP